MTIPDYIDKLNSRYRTGISTEHSYRADLQNLLESLAPDVLVTNEPARIKCGAPDYIITKGKISVGYIEAKDIGKPLDSKEFKEQFDRYRSSLSNLIITDYLEFRLFLDGSFVSSVTIGEIQGNKIVACNSYFETFSDIIKNFCTHVGQTIKSASKLSKMMAAKARLMANVIDKALTIGDIGDQVNEAQNLNLQNQYNSFKQYLIHDISEKGFADIYSQTIAYGMFAARLNDPTLVDFSRQEAAELIPKSNPFLRNLFQYIAGYDLDDRIKWIIDELADVFRATNVAELLQDFGKSTQQNDPMIHFYETFLAEYDPKLRKSRGVYYTPEPVVNFIVRAVDDILQTEFGLSQGLADTSKIRIKVPQQGKLVEQEVHKVQILDPAAGTGTFLAEVIKQIYKQFEGQQGVWSNYVEEHLIPRLNGFEILMASYAMAHLKLDLLLKETGYVPKKQQRLKVFLTNSLEEHHPDTGTLFAGWLSAEANEANHVKRDSPVMVVLGNPPYSVSSSNKGEWIQNLIEDYKKDLNERKINIDDDYIKFIRYGEFLIEKNGEGILAFISNNSFIDGITYRQMRKHLLQTFDKILVLDLHGNVKKKEIASDGSNDENVFDIQQGVAISLFVKLNTSKKKALGKVLHIDLYGNRKEKYNFLKNDLLIDINWNNPALKDPSYFFVPKDFRLEEEYYRGIRISDLMPINSTGVETKCDEISVKFTYKELDENLKLFNEFDLNNLRNHFKQKRESSGWNFAKAKSDIISGAFTKQLLYYRPFDLRYSILTPQSGGFIGRSRYDVMKHFLYGSNIGIQICRQQSTYNFQHIIATKYPVDRNSISLQTKESTYVFPLYLYNEPNKHITILDSQERQPNFNHEIIRLFAEKLGIRFISEKGDTFDLFSSIDIFDYIYALLHSPVYRDRFKEFLKIDFPRIPYPKDKETFWQLVKLGGELRQIHLLESPIVNNFITTFPITGTNEVGKVSYEDSKVWINGNQYFDKVPLVAWEFYIGGYQPAQKWLKDRKGRVLSFDDIMHYQKIIVALSETDRIMKDVDKIQFFE